MRISITRNDIEKRTSPQFMKKLDRITQWEPQWIRRWIQPKWVRKWETKKWLWERIKFRWERTNGNPSLFQSDGFTPRPHIKIKENTQSSVCILKHSRILRARKVSNEVLRDLKEVKQKLEEIFIDILKEKAEWRSDTDRLEMAAKEILKFMCSKDSAENNFDMHLVFDTDKSSVVISIINQR